MVQCMSCALCLMRQILNVQVGPCDPRKQGFHHVLYNEVFPSLMSVASLLLPVESMHLRAADEECRACGGLCLQNHLSQLIWQTFSVLTALWRWALLKHCRTFIKPGDHAQCTLKVPNGSPKSSTTFSTITKKPSHRYFYSEWNGFVTFHPLPGCYLTMCALQGKKVSLKFTWHMLWIIAVSKDISLNSKWEMALI